MYLIFYKKENSSLRLSGIANAIEEAKEFIKKLLGSKEDIILTALPLDITDYDVWFYQSGSSQFKVIWANHDINERTLENENKGYLLFP